MKQSLARVWYSGSKKETHFWRSEICSNLPGRQNISHIPRLKTEIAESLLGGAFKYFFFHPYLGKIPILTNIFQMG